MKDAKSMSPWMMEGANKFSLRTYMAARYKPSIKACMTLAKTGRKLGFNNKVEEMS